jgi:hypothetical protein
MSRFLNKNAGTAKDVPADVLAKAQAEQKKRLNVNIAESKHERFRIACMLSKTNMTDAIEAFIDQYIEENGER